MDYSKLIELYKEWNSRINVISRKDIDNIYEHHVLHSLAIAEYLRRRYPAGIWDSACYGVSEHGICALRFDTKENYRGGSRGYRTRAG